MRVLVTGMSGTGKSTVVHELRRRGYAAYDADDDGYSEPAPGGAWHWRVEAIDELLARYDETLVFFAGCSDEQAGFEWDCIALLTTPEPVMVSRVETRATNPYGKGTAEMARILEDLREVEPLLRRRANVVIDTTQPLDDVIDQLLEIVMEMHS
jgi:RNase adaptor protein for sRNA GlmZ degradation